ncbi:hypothetical protein CRG98_013977 [Punica granatum]|uniref:Uncharacterized protein n=1 Tax=Punica granatum TaxID=22663 RepID=A0A2I0KAY5_PUNGR|nr:hypothetical protein CRG98_013977 [Punica granatum]
MTQGCTRWTPPVPPHPQPNPLRWVPPTSDVVTTSGFSLWDGCVFEIAWRIISSLQKEKKQSGFDSSSLNPSSNAPPLVLSGSVDKW